MCSVVFESRRSGIARFDCPPSLQRSVLMSANIDPKTSGDAHQPEEPTLTVNLSGKKHQLGIARAFSLAHQLVGRGKLESAAQVLEWLEENLPNDRRVKVLHARVEARQGNYAHCSQLLHEVFLDEDQTRDIPGPLHEAIVYRAVGLIPDARSQLRDICSNHPELPSLWLFAGDMWLTVGRPDKAELAWEEARRQDEQEPKVIATAASHRIHELKANISKPKP